MLLVLKEKKQTNKWIKIRQILNIVSNILVWNISHIFSIHKLNNKMKKKEEERNESRRQGSVEPEVK